MAGATVACVLAGAIGGPASAATNEEARAEVADLDPSALYPARLPERLEDANVTFDANGSSFNVTWDRGCCGKDGDTRLGEIGWNRFPARRMKQDFKLARSRGFKPRRKVVGGRKVWYLCGHVCGYEFKRGRYAYGVFGIYYTEGGRRDERDMRAIIAALEPVGDIAEPNAGLR